MNTTVRNPDLPKHKETVMSQLFGQFEGFLVSKGLSKGKEYATRITELFDCSRKILWIDEYHPDLQITICLNSIHMTCEFGLVLKATSEVLHREKLEDLRYLISTGTELELNTGSQAKFNAFFESFKEQFKKLEVAA